MKKTILNRQHHHLNANLAEFGGYEMPLWYPKGAKAEHLAVIQHAGLFDTSHMAVLLCEGTDARKLIQKCFSKDLDDKNGKGLSSGKSIYGVFISETGGVIDDAICSQMHQDLYFLVVNAGMGGIIREHLRQYKENLQADIIDLTDQVGKIDLQGPLSGKVIKSIIKTPDQVMKGLNYFTFKGGFNDHILDGKPVELKNDVPLLISRTGYTGELGFELFIKIENTPKVWQMILDLSEQFSILPCGLAARDSLRTGAGLPLSHQDIGDWLFLNNPWTFTLPYTFCKKDFTKNFIGSEVLLAAESNEYTYPFAGYDLRKVSPQDAVVVENEGGPEIGTVLTCVTDMAIGRYNEKIFSISSPHKPEGFVPKGLSCGFIKVNKQLENGHVFYIQDKRRKLKAQVRQTMRPHRTARKYIE